MRNYNHLELYLNLLLGDLYGQPPDAGHTGMCAEVINLWIPAMTSVKTVLDLGCGEACIAEPYFTALGKEYTGITLGSEAITAQKTGKNVLNMDFNFLEFEDNSFDLLFSRHSLEHSPMPLLTLMEWKRVAIDFLCVVLPNPEHFTYKGKNHYSVMLPEQFRWLCEVSGWNVIWENYDEKQELRFMCEKVRT
jgi:SAM-dependent methyltransferase